MLQSHINPFPATGPATETQASANDQAIFADRAENKFFLPAKSARAFVDGLRGHVESHRFRGEGASQIPRPVHFITTLYFDTKAGHIASACRDGSANVKLRAREYYDEHPDLTEIATSRKQLKRHNREVWLELKAKTDGRTRKLRFPLPAGEVAGFLAGGVITQEAAAMQRAAGNKDGEALLREVWKLCRRVGEPLRPDSLVHYRRRAWQDPQGQLRITLDTRLSFHPAGQNFFREFTCLGDKVGSKAAGTLDDFLIEIKLRGPIPHWLDALGQRVELTPAVLGARQFSKFLAASDAVNALRSGCKKSRLGL